MRIKSSNVLIIGITRVTTEIAKNCVLAGTNLIIEDGRDVNDDNRNFLIALEVPETDGMRQTEAPYIHPVGLSVGQATATALKRLNEHPTVAYMHMSEARSEATLTRCSAVVVSARYLEYNGFDITQIASACRKVGIGFFLVFDSSAVSWAFSDFGPTHIVESHTPPLKRDDKTGERKAENKIEEFAFSSFGEFSRCRVEDNMISVKTSFPTAEAVFVKLFVEWSVDNIQDGPEPKRARISSGSPKKSSKKSFNDFAREVITNLSFTGRAEKYLTSFRDTLISSVVAIYDEFAKNIESLPHIAAVHGALITQEIIKYVTKRDPPLVNQIILNPVDCGAIVIKTPKNLSSRIVSNGSSNADIDAEDDVEILNGNRVDIID